MRDSGPVRPPCGPVQTKESGLGWLRLPTDQGADLSRLQSVSSARLADDFDDALVVGMGGCSLCPDVFRKTFRDISGALKLHVLDSTDPAQILACERRLDLSRTLFIVSSKSGTTLESNLLFRYFFHRVESRVAHGRVGERFIAVTDHGSSLDDLAREYRFREVFHGRSNIGGRYSALSDFGIVPAAAAGIEVDRLLARAAQMQRQCDEHVPVRLNPGAMLGLTLGVAALTGRDKLTLVTSQTVCGVRRLGRAARRGVDGERGPGNHSDRGGETCRTRRLPYGPSLRAGS